MRNILVMAVALAGAPAALAQPSPYAGQESRAIKALSAQEASDLAGAKGMGLANAAELNGYPGPMHVLELADGLALTPQQRTASHALMVAHKERARLLGEQILDAEGRLDRQFADRSITPERLNHLTAEIGRLQALLRAEHLQTHLAQTDLLDRPQVRRYAELRGYAAHRAAPDRAATTHQGHHR